MFKKEELEKSTLTNLKKIAKDLNLEGTSKFKKSELVDIIVKIQNDENSDVEPVKREEIIREGILEVMQDGFGFLRSQNFQTGDDDIYVSNVQIKRFRLKTGDWIKCIIRLPREGERYGALIYVKEVNGDSIETCLNRKSFEELKPIYPNEKFNLDIKGMTANRIIDIISPIGKGQRGMIVAPPKAGKTTLLKNIANGIIHSNKDIYMIILLIDERPEEVTDIKESIKGENVEIIYSTFDERPENHKKVTEMVLERAKRLVEHEKDVVVILDSLTRLGRAYNLVVPASGRTLSGGLDPSALYMPKKFFGAARNIENGGSLTIIASALVETGSKMDEVIFEEFKGTGNMELVLDRRLSEKRIFPAINVLSSSTRREDLLLDQETIKATYELRKILSNSSLDTVEDIIDMIKEADNNKEFIKMLSKRMLGHRDNKKI